MQAPSLPVEQHLVSKGYQKHFATADKKLTILAAADRRVVEHQRPTKRNWSAQHWNSVISAHGEIDARLEREWGRLEPSVLRRIREVSSRNCSAAHRGAIINLFAIHLVRSKAFADFRAALHSSVIDAVVAELIRDPELVERFKQQLHREPAASELESLVRQQAAAMELSRQGVVESMLNLHNRIAAKLDEYRVQVVEAPAPLPGFVLGDIPVVHAHIETQRFGFRDRLAIGDANLVIAPLTRRVAVCFTADNDRPVNLTTKTKLRRVNNLFIAAAREEVACHPDDTLDAARLCRNRLPIQRP